MGRSFASVRQSVKAITGRWERSARAVKREDRPYGRKLAGMTEMHSSEAFYGCDEPLEAALFSVLVEVIKRQGQEKTCRDDDVDP
jgi:hypothetical protein